MLLDESCLESCELCEEAKSSMQEFDTKKKAFVSLAEKLKEQYAQIQDKPKRPVGVIQEVLDEQMVSIQCMNIFLHERILVRELFSGIHHVIDAAYTCV